MKNGHKPMYGVGAFAAQMITMAVGRIVAIPLTLFFLLWAGELAFALPDRVSEMIAGQSIETVTRVLRELGAQSFHAASMRVMNWIAPLMGGAIGPPALSIDRGAIGVCLAVLLTVQFAVSAVVLFRGRDEDRHFAHIGRLAIMTARWRVFHAVSQWGALALMLAQPAPVAERSVLFLLGGVAILKPFFTGFLLWLIVLVIRGDNEPPRGRAPRVRPSPAKPKDPSFWDRFERRD